MKRCSWFIPFVAAVALYLPTLDAELVWDDEIVQTRQLVAFQSVRDVFFPPDGIQEWSRSYYRPVVVISYLIDRALYGNERFGGHHLTNVLIHALVCVYVTLLARRVLLRHRLGEWGAVAAGLTFAVPLLLVLVPRAESGPTLSTQPPQQTTRRSKKKRKKARRGERTASPEDSLVTIVLRWVPFAVLYFIATATYFVLRDRADCTVGHSLDLGLGSLLARACRAAGYYAGKVVAVPPQSAFVTIDEMPSLAIAVRTAGTREKRAESGPTLSTQPPQQTTRRSKKKRKKARRGERTASPEDSLVTIVLRWVPFAVLYFIATATYFVLRDRAD